ncbi:alpha-actinin 1 [Trichoderma arundinaceum]|uniref:Alpha-actinin 1 n=1 Tax=Trichoderma arundinaceum TaxID=490622 RepID=A0A395NV88_TRIAR|nr:alpha-actinin 1 [Trichoderma arundinaceum]
MAYYNLPKGATGPLKAPKKIAPTGPSWKELQPGNVELAEQFPEFCLQPQRPSGGHLNIDTKLAARAASATATLQLQLQHQHRHQHPITPLGLCTPPSSPVSSPDSRPGSPVSAGIAKAEADPVPLPVQRLQRPLSLSLPRPRCASYPPQRSGRDKEESCIPAAHLQRSEKRSSSLGTKVLSQSPTPSKLSSPPKPPPKPAKFSRQPRSAEIQSRHAVSDHAQAESKASAADVLVDSSSIRGVHDQFLTRMTFSEQQRWITVQEKTFTKWLNTKIVARNLEVKDLVPDLSDGVMLIHLLECLSHESLGRYASRPKLRVQRFENANLALDFIKSRGIQMTNIGAEDVVDGNRKIVLGLIWTLILRFTISDINEEGMSAKEGLLLWCQRKTACYDEVEVRDFSSSWNDGLAFCALLDIHRPDLIDFDTLDKSDHRGNMQLAFDIAHEEIGIPKLLDVEDVCDVAKPDERSLMTYIAYWFHAFSQMEKVENAGRRVEKFFNNMQGAWEMQNAYEKRMRELLKNIRGQVEQWHTAKFEGTYADAKAQAAEFSEYKRGKKREWVAEKSELATLLGNIKTKLSTYRLRPYEPPQEVSQEVIEGDWKNLTKSEMARAQLINETIRDIKNALRKSFADKANDFAMALNTMQLAISGLDGDIEDQLHHVKKLSENLPPLDRYLSTIAEVDAMCEEANIEENDFTTYTYDELAYELTLVRSSVQKKLSFLENQMVARNMTNLTPIQLEEFESVFRHFDRDASNSLQELEFSAALASLGLVFSEDEMHDYFVETSGGKEYVTFEQFIRFMVDVTEDQNTAEQVFQSFREVADGKPYVTEMDLRHSLVPEEVIDLLLDMMPPHSGPDMSRDRGKAQFDYISFMEKLMSDENADDDIPAGVLQDRTNIGDDRPRRDSKVNGVHA